MLSVQFEIAIYVLFCHHKQSSNFQANSSRVCAGTKIAV